MGVGARGPAGEPSTLGRDAPWAFEVVVLLLPVRSSEEFS